MDVVHGKYKTLIGSLTGNGRQGQEMGGMDGKWQAGAKMAGCTIILLYYSNNEER